MAGRDTRFTTSGQVFISEVTNTDALLKNLSSSGLCIETKGFMDVLPKTRYSIDIVPEKEANMEKFPLEVESRWVKAKMKSSESGFVIVVPPGTTGKTLLEQYLGYLASQPNNNEENNDYNDSEASGPIDISAENQ
ncbi:MAG: hypothetical protein FWG29_00990 [Treponema sp.]|nr:hypothetical protein [Treponema sp.]